MNYGIYYYISKIVGVVLLPVLMMIISSRYANKPPKYNDGGIKWSGYRMGMADRSRETWEFSQKYFFSLEQWVDLFVLFGSIVAIYKQLGKIPFEWSMLKIIIVQVIIFLLPAIPTEIKLHKIFDKNGKRKE